MKETTFSYSNNGKFPIKYVPSRGRCASSGTVEIFNDHTEQPETINLNYRSLANLNIGFKTKGVSLATQRKIAKHCNVLALCSKKRNVRNSSGKYVQHFTTFITLTLPSEQEHTDQEITKTVLGTFLDKCRKLGLLANYVWRAEKQKNKNIHYHILTDTFASFSLFQNVWFLALEKLNYLQKYTAKFSGMSFLEYQKQPFAKNIDLVKLAGMYAKGVRNSWRKPPSVHTTEISSIDGVAKYVSKYISKSDKENKNIVTGRSWGKSESVSKSVKEFCGNVELSKIWYEMAVNVLKKKVFSTDFFSIVLCPVYSILSWFPDLKKSFKKLLQMHYTPCDYWRNSVGLFV